jgi:hypothetical protein
MRIQRLIIAAVATRSVFRRFAELSEDEKKEVVEKVKTKMKDKADPDDKEEAPEAAPQEEEGKPDAEQPPEEAKPTGDAEEPAGEEDDKGDKEDEDIFEDEGDEGDEDDANEEGDDDTEEVEEVEPDSTEPENAEPEAEPDGEEPTGEPVEVDEDKKGEIESIVNDLVSEVKTIKQDGQVAPKDVMGLIQSMMEMVNLLVQAKPPTRRRGRRGATREFEIAIRVADSEIQVGKLVKYSQSYLRMISDPMSVKNWTGLVKSVRQVGSRTVAEVAWNSGETREVDVRNLDLIPRSERLLHRYSTTIAGIDISVGDSVMYSRNFLRSIGEFGEMGHWKGVVKSVRPMGGMTLAEVQWDNGDAPMKVNVKNLILTSRRHLELASAKTAGHSYTVEAFNVEVEGWQPFNVDVINEINRNVWFDYRDDQGDMYEDGHFQITGTKRLTPPMTYNQEQEMKQRKEAPVTQVLGRIPKGSAPTALKALQQQLGRKFNLVVRELR